MHNSHNQPYAANAFDFVAFYIIPDDAWYIIPEETMRGQGYLYIRVWGRSKYKRYKEAWELLKMGPAEGIVDVIHACVPSPAEEAIWGVMET